MSTELAVRETSALETVRPASGLALSFGEMTMRVAQVDQFYREVMQDGTDYGKIPGTDKPTLYQPGAQMLDQIFGYSPRFEIMPASVLDWQRPIPFFHYVVMCRLVSLRSGETVAEGIGSCNSYEDKYRWRNAKRVCPDCKAETIIKGKQEYGGGWLCFKKNGGCGAKFRDGEAIIEDQTVGRVENEDTASLENTVSKMAQKRAHVAATLNATGASRIFTQDIEDLPQFQEAMARGTVVQASSAPTPIRGTVIDDAPPAPTTPQPADAESRARFDADWKQGIARAVACGVTPDDAPPPTATVGQLGKAKKALREDILARETLNAELLTKITEVKAAVGPDEIKDVDPATCTSAEIHEMLATLAKMLAASAAAPTDDQPF